ncbi:hypothetical protein [Actinomyces capricornis]|uniref:Nuclear transport factor 2 family protein n=1 Tax=Actinomyces capricornis TaxID=2755559 RepID=A0ABN6K9F9_9ACTO|nr:hypothetical protein [Actinomyces capricornis]BDA64998.1 hypothetical protein MANAM107_18320 [Actinomyces capricornis]
MTASGTVRRSIAAGCALLIAAGGAVACSADGGSSTSQPTVPAFSPQASAPDTAGEQEHAAASASASASTQEVTTQSLSNEEIGYEVTSIPEDLNGKQQDALKAFVAYDQFTWNVWFTPAGTGAGTQGAEELAKGDELAFFQGNYAALEPGERLSGPVHVAFLYVDVQDAYAPARAEVVACTDRRDVRSFNGAGQETTDPSQQGRYQHRYILDNSDGKWKMIGSIFESQNECTA